MWSGILSRERDNPAEAEAVDKAEGNMLRTVMRGATALPWSETPLRMKGTFSRLNIPLHMIAVYASQPSSPATTQHSLEGGSLLPYPHRSFTGWTAPASPGARSGRGPGHPGPPAQIPACGFPAPGSCRRSNAIEVRGFGGPCTPNPQARSFGYTPHPALSPGVRCYSPSLRPAAFPPPSPPPICGRFCSRLHGSCTAVRLLASPVAASPPRLPVAAQLRHSGLGEMRSPRFRQ